MNHSWISIQFPKQSVGVVSWINLHGCSRGVAIAEAARQFDGIVFLIVPDMLSASRLENELRFFSAEPILIFPDWEILPYDSFSPHQDIVSERLQTLSQLPFLKKCIVIVSIATLMHRLPPKDFVGTQAIWIKKNQAIHQDQFRMQMASCGYSCVSEVSSHGEFAIRGSIIDLFPMGAEKPYRIDLFDDEIETIRTFDPDTQRSIEKIDEIKLLPAHEFSLDEKSIDRFRKNFREQFDVNPIRCQMYEDVSAGKHVPGLEYYLSLFFDETKSLLDYLPEKTLIIRDGDIFEQADQFLKSVNIRYDQLSHDVTRPILKPEKIFLTKELLFSAFKSFPNIKMIEESQSTADENKTGVLYAKTELLPKIDFDHKLKQPLARLEQFLSKQSQKILFCAETLGRREALLDLLNTIQIHPQKIESWPLFLSSTKRICITVAPIDLGSMTNEFIIIPETEIFGERIYQRRRRQKRKVEAEQIVQHLSELNIGDPVVHVDHGVGRYQGLQTITIDEKTDEYLVILYAHDDKLYVPVSSLNLISRYSSVDVEHAPLHALGGSVWEKQKEKAQKRIRDVAAELLDIYAKRAARQGFQFEKRDEHYLAFAESFPFEETPDQETAILAVISDMESAKPMDRLICGDVGFGKTEVAMRAAFIAVHSGKQVCILTPTTLLAHQHIENFKNRFADWPISIEELSRFETKKEQEIVLKKLIEGRTDIVIGTHRLIQEDVQFKNLGLLIIDEEHRFGVHQKEKLKSLRSEVDILTLTATPIPRTLNMSLSGIRDLSIIATPPEKRLSIKTFLYENNDELMREAIQRELLRGGQVYVLHNKVEDIERFAQAIQTLVPDARVGFAHGQMHERALEKVMSDFYHRRFNVLICTTIIETGIDIPTANTMIIDRADKFGLAQLHQLRGRVGRSHHQAYCYLMVPSKKALTKDAEKRLDAIKMHEDLGAGFVLAMHDMEIRGAGEFLGEEQSGQIQAIGFDLYMEMLEKAVHALKSGQKIDFEAPLHHPVEMDLGLAAIIPENYLPDVHSRLILYKRISNAKDSQTLEDIRVEMIDRFGLLPAETKRLFEIAALKLKAAKIGIIKIKSRAEECVIEFNEAPNVDSVEIIQLIQTQPKKYQLTGKNKLKIKFDEQQKTDIIGFLTECVDSWYFCSTIDED